MNRNASNRKIVRRRLSLPQHDRCIPADRIVVRLFDDIYAANDVLDRVARGKIKDDPEIVEKAKSFERKAWKYLTEYLTIRSIVMANE